MICNNELFELIKFFHDDTKRLEMIMKVKTIGKSRMLEENERLELIQLFSCNDGFHPLLQTTRNNKVLNMLSKNKIIKKHVINVISETNKLSFEDQLNLVKSCLEFKKVHKMLTSLVSVSLSIKINYDYDTNRDDGNGDSFSIYLNKMDKKDLCTLLENKMFHNMLTVDNMLLLLEKYDKGQIRIFKGYVKSILSKVFIYDRLK